MLYRKVLKIGNTYGVTIPVKWLDRQGIMKGDILRLEIVGDEIHVKPERGIRDAIKRRSYRCNKGAGV